MYQRTARPSSSRAWAWSAGLSVAAVVGATDGDGLTKTGRFWSSDGTTAGLLYPSPVLADTAGAAIDWTAPSPIMGVDGATIATVANPFPVQVQTGSNVIGAVTQSGAFTVSGTGTAASPATGLLSIQGLQADDAALGVTATNPVPVGGKPADYGRAILAENERLASAIKAAEGARALADGAVHADLIDQLVAGDLLAAACVRASQLAAEGAQLPRARDRLLDADRVATQVEQARANLNARQRLQPAYSAVLDAVAATAAPFEQGLARERQLFLGLVPTTQARALRYQFKVEREASKLPAELQATPRPLQQIAVIGAGTMGTGIAISALDAGLGVTLLEQDGAALERGRQRIGDHYSGRVAAGKMEAAVAAAAEACLQTTLDWAELARADGRLMDARLYTRQANEVQGELTQ